ncbi:helix-turn-helix domain-containing protein [Brevibacillus massiliensis]|uniref:helix-turn-helix domain-containing protein n=1 Tax=Brevibacillus massiliensis TaxID=1118054 RepID=UPI0003732C1F|nr:helix-turn-helix transcriptional regulator [Brevibacillus massiliensis]
MLGERLVKLRGNRTQKQIAEQLGISRARYSHYENNHVQPSNELLKKMSDLYGVSIDYLLGRSDSELNFLEKEFLKDVASIPLDEVIQKYPLKFMGEQLNLTSDDKKAILAFIKTLHELKKK